MILDAIVGFSSEALEVIQRKPTAKILDCTAGNRHIWGLNKMRDDVIFTDKEKGLKIQPDLFSTWCDLPKHFPKDYFSCVIFDPPHQTAGINKACRWSISPDESINTWYGAYSSNRELLIDIMRGVHSLSNLSSRLCFKWCSEDRSSTATSIDRILSVFVDWDICFMVPIKKTKSTTTWWVKLVRK